jgi:hypothetical protein
MSWRRRIRKSVLKFDQGQPLFIGLGAANAAAARGAARLAEYREGAAQQMPDGDAHHHYDHDQLPVQSHRHSNQVTNNMLIW